VCVLMTDPPLLPLLAARVKAAGVSVGQCFGKEVEDSELKNRTTAIPPHRATRRVAVWLMDLYPEALAASGRLSESNPLYRWYFEKRQRALAEADLLICLGHAQKELLGAGARQSGVCQEAVSPSLGSVGQFLPSAAPHAVSQTRLSEAEETEEPNYQTTELPRPPDALGAHTVVVPPWDDRGNIALATEESLRNLALYAGNLGEAHCFEEILGAAPYLPADWKIRFAVRGAKASALLSKLRSDEWRVTGDESGSACAFAAANDSGVTKKAESGNPGVLKSENTESSELGAQNEGCCK